MYLQTCKIYEKLNRMLLTEKELSQPLIESLLYKNTKLLEQGIARKVNLDKYLPWTVQMTDHLYNSQKKGIFKIFFSILGAKNYIYLLYLLKLITKKKYAFDLLNGNQQWKQ
jgi:hypothetical protein